MAVKATHGELEDAFLELLADWIRKKAHSYDLRVAARKVDDARTDIRNQRQWSYEITNIMLAVEAMEEGRPLKEWEGLGWQRLLYFVRDRKKLLYEFRKFTRRTAKTTTPSP